jgi:hypothetical protein
MRRRWRLEPVQIAEAFGRALNCDDFAALRELLDPECAYAVGQENFEGPEAISESYEFNMLTGREQLDDVVWGESGIEEIGNNEFVVYFTDHLKLNGHSFIHRCRQQIAISEEKFVTRIQHIPDPQELQRLGEFYDRVGYVLDADSGGIPESLEEDEDYEAADDQPASLSGEELSDNAAGLTADDYSGEEEPSGFGTDPGSDIDLELDDSLTLEGQEVEGDSEFVEDADSVESAPS